MMDLHTHSTCSDGCFTPNELLIMAQSLQLRYFAISDHDTMDAYETIDTTIFSGKLIHSVEMTFQYNGIRMDVLGYGVNKAKLEASGLLHHLSAQTQIAKEQKYLKKMQEVAQSLGLQFHKDSAITLVHQRANDVICDDMLSFPNNEAILRQLGIVNRTTFYRNHYLQKSSPFYMKQELKAPSLKKVANAIHESGGKTFLAHLFVYDIKDAWGLLNELLSTGYLDGIECIHRNHTYEQTEQLIAYCHHHHLLKSGGSDFHKLDHHMGYGNQGTYFIEETIAQDWLNNL